MVESLPQDRAVEGSNPCPPFGKDNNEEYGYGLSEDMSYHFVANLLENCQLKNLKKLTVALLKEQLLMIPEVCATNPDISKILY